MKTRDICLVLGILLLSVAAQGDPVDPKIEAEAKAAINSAEETLQPIITKFQEANFDYAVNDTPENKEAARKATEAYNAAYTEMWESLTEYYGKEYSDPELQRRFDLIAKPGTAALSDDKQNEMAAEITSMNEYFLSEICPFDNQECEDSDRLTMDDLEVIMGQERRVDALEYYWVKWREVAGAPTKPGFVKVLELQNEAARNELNGFESATEMWLQPYIATDYTTENFQAEVEALWAELKPLYGKILGYVRYRLRESDQFSSVEGFGAEDAIPAHILGNMWAQSWENIYDLVVPYPEVELVNITVALQDWTVDNMFHEADRFFTDMGLEEMNDIFWKKSYKEQDDDYTSVCHASAWDFYSREGDVAKDDFRIKMCTDKNQEDFITIHHEMGHIEYFMAYAEDESGGPDPVPLMFRTGANPGFHEAIGDTIALSVSTPAHLQKLADNPPTEALTRHRALAKPREDSDADKEKLLVNQLMMAALEKFVFLPYAYILDKFRWDAFDGTVTEEEYNYHWWKLRLEEQGVKPPVLRLKDEDFDIGCKYHVANNVPYVRYFVAMILQYQFHTRLCQEAKWDEADIQNCDIDGDQNAGALLKSMMEKGNSQEWTKTLSEFLGGNQEDSMNAQALLKYFEPLETWLDAQEKELEYSLEWRSDDSDLDSLFVTHIPATVPIVVGVVLAVMIVVVVVAYFVGKRRQGKVLDPAMAEEGAGKPNPAFELGEARRGSGSSHSSRGSK